MTDRSARERILDAAVLRIASDGIDAVRIARIAMDARVSTALVHYHFATREALLAEALEHSFEIAGDVRDQEGDPATRLRAMVDSCLPLPGELERDWVLWVELAGQRQALVDHRLQPRDRIPGELRHVTRRLEGVLQGLGE